jgi:hypothetical protein
MVKEAENRLAVATIQVCLPSMLAYVYQASLPFAHLGIFDGPDRTPRCDAI